MDYSATKINFLGVNITKAGNKLETDLYCKPTDTHQYLHAQSWHSNVNKSSITYGLLQGLKEFVKQKKNLINISSN